MPPHTLTNFEMQNYYQNDAQLSSKKNLNLIVFIQEMTYLK